MKKIMGLFFMFFVFFVANMVLAEEKKPINVYDGLEFGMTLEQVKTSIKKSGNYMLRNVPGESYYQYFNGRKRVVVSVWFTNQKLSQIRVKFEGGRVTKMESAKEVFNENKKECISMWGVPTRDEDNLVVWDRDNNIGALRLDPPENPYDYPNLRLVLSTVKDTKEVQLAIQGN